MAAVAEPLKTVGWRRAVATVTVCLVLAIAVYVVVSATLSGEHGETVFVIPSAMSAVLGFLVVARRPDNRIGFLLLGVGASASLLSLGGTVRPGLSSETALAMASIGSDVWFVATFLQLFILLPIWFPTGYAMNRLWLWVQRSGVAVAALTAFGAVFAAEVCIAWPPGGGDCLAFASNPWGVGFVTADMADITFLPLMVVGLLGLASLVTRFKRSGGMERQQMKWLVLAASLLVLVFVLSVEPIRIGIGLNDTLLMDLLLGVAYSAIPFVCGMAVLRYGLFDIDRIISRTVAYALVVGTLTIAYLGVILGVGALAAAVSSDVDLPIPVVATALVAIGFQPVRKRALGVADRLVFGRQRTPYEALAGIKEVELDDLLPRIAQLVTESTAAQGAVVWLSTGTELEPVAVFPDGIHVPGPVPLDEGQIPDSPDSGEVFPLLHQGSLLGAITTVLDEGEELPAVDVRLLKDVASHAATTIKGVLDATPLPDGIVTFLMTDIEGSTRLWDEDPERMAAALRKHDELIQRLIREGGGVLVKWKGEGDSTFSVFIDPGDAVEAAMALQEAIRNSQWDLVRPISIRAALHTGDAELRERDYYGQTVNRCARIRSLGHGGQTLVSAATRELIRSSPREPLTFKDLGEHQLRDFKQPERVYQVTTKTRTGTTEPRQAAEI